MIMIGLRTIVLAGLASALAFPSLQAGARELLKSEFSQTRGFSDAVVTDGGRIVWLSGKAALRDEQGKPIAGDFEAQARAIFQGLDQILKRAGGSLRDITTVTVYLTDPRLLPRLGPIRREFFADGNFPASTTITVHSLPEVGMMLEIQAVAVIGGK